MKVQHLFLTGQPGVGKTTLLKTLVDDLNERHNAVGFYTEEVRNENGRIGFDVVSLSGTRFPLARIKDNKPSMENPRIGRYSVFINDFNRNLSILLPSKRCNEHNQKSLVFIDEIGKMELLSHNFKKKVTKLLHNAELQVIGTLPVKKGAGIPYVENIKQRSDVLVFNVTYENRNTLGHELLKHI